VLQLRQKRRNDMPIVYEDVAYGTLVPVKVVRVDTYPRLVTLMSFETDPAPGRKPEAYICIYPRDSEPAERAQSAQPDDTGVLIFTDNEGHGFWNYFPDDAAAVRAEMVKREASASHLAEASHFIDSPKKAKKIQIIRLKEFHRQRLDLELDIQRTK
jgi:hypothetical protein